jgi:hypothetical protein
MFKQIFFKYNATLLVLTMYFLFMLYPLTTALLNPEPDPSMLETEAVRIIKANARTPNVLAVSVGGEQRKFNFADSLYIAPVGGGGSRFSGLRPSQLAELNGCEATVKFDRIESIFFPNLRIWALHCGGLDWTVEDATRTFRADNRSAFWISIAGHIFFISLGCLTCYFDRRKKPRK